MRHTSLMQIVPVRFRQPPKHTEEMIMKQLMIDIETYSSVDIGKSGAYKYAESEDFEILLFAYKEDDKPTKIIDLAQGEVVPPDIINALTDPKITKHAYNAAFEWWCINHWNMQTIIDQWQCTMIHAMYCGYPAGLEATGKAIGLPEDKQKLTTGKALIRYFCSPCKPTKTNGGRKRNLPEHDPVRWQLFKEYCIQDVEAEYAIEQRLNSQPVPDQVWTEWHHDIEINARGVHIDTDLVNGALFIDQLSTEDLIEKSYKITGVDNPKSNAQMLSWIQGRCPDMNIENLQKETVSNLLDNHSEELPEDVCEALRLRQMINKTSVSKYEAMARALGSDDRVRGLLQFYGANRTGRWAGRLVQEQNLPRNYISTLDIARDQVKKKRYIGLELLYGNPPDTLSQLIRTAFIPSEGNKFIVSDFSAIEARVIAWLAHEEWVMKVFENNGDIYCATASQMFGVPVEKHGVNSELRQKGKVATLALGYQGGPNALIAMGALKMGIPEEELPDITAKWRNANSHIVDMWAAVEDAAVHCIKTGEPTRPALRVRDPERARYNEELCGREPYSFSDYFKYDAPINNIEFRLEADLIYGLSYMTVKLPSGRKLFYNEPHLTENRFGKQAVHYVGLNQTTKKWSTDSTYGGKLTENIVQAIARDCLAVTLERVIAAGYKPVMHIHDEIVIDATQDQNLDDVNEIFAQPIEWAPGLLLKGAGFESDYYMKD